MGKSVNLAVVSFRFRSSLRMLDQSDGTYIAQVVICRHRSLVAFAVSAAPRTSHKQERFCAGRSAYRDGRRCVHRREGPMPVYCTSFAQGERHPQTHHVIHPQPSILLAETSVYGAVSTGHCICSWGRRAAQNDLTSPHSVHRVRVIHRLLLPPQPWPLFINRDEAQQGVVGAIMGE
jgi:hypothetical protein